MPTKTPVKKPSRMTANNPKLSPDEWPTWTSHLAKRKRPRPLRALMDTGRASALEWPLHANFPDSASAELVRYLNRFKSPQTRGNGELARRLEAWLDDAPQQAPSALFAIECLAWAHAMPQFSQQLPAAAWCQLLDHLVTVCRDAAGIVVTDQPLAQQLLYGELPLTLAYLFPELQQCTALAEPARNALSDGILEVLDGEGLINVRFHAAMRPLLGCWTRCGMLARSMREPCFSEPAEDQYQWLVRESLRLARFDGSQVLTDNDSGRWEPSLFQAALMLTSKRKDAAIASVALPAGLASATETKKTKDRRGKAKTKSKENAKAKVKAKSKDKTKPKLPAAAIHSEWAGTAVLKRSWNRDDASLVLAYHDQALALELNCGSETVWSGPWGFEVEVDGKPLEITDQWEEVCWVGDKDVAYVEIEAKLGGGWRLQRQLLLGRDEQFLFVGDALLGNRSGTIKYKATLPLAEGIEFQPADETREGRLARKRGLANVLPLELPEWRLPPQGGTLEQTEEGLVLTQVVEGFRLFAPLFFDLCPARLKKPLTWRKLTIAENLDITSPDDATGYRVQVGNEQWLFYRSLGPVANRTILGQNYSAEFVAARFPTSGEAEKLIEIE